MTNIKNIFEYERWKIENMQVAGKHGGNGKMREWENEKMRKWEKDGKLERWNNGKGCHLIH